MRHVCGTLPFPGLQRNLARNLEMGGYYMGLMLMESIGSNGPSRAHQITVRTAQPLDGCIRHRSVLA
jgi:hypothetical protein